MNSVDAAKAYNRSEREKVEQLTGIRFVGDEPVPPLAVGWDMGREPSWVAVQCPQCAHVSVGETTGRAVRSITAHLVKKHHVRKEQL